MENDLNRSVRMLEDALSTQGRSPFKKSLLRSRTSHKESAQDLCTPATPYEMERLMAGDFTVGDTMLTSVIGGNKTVTGSVIRAHDPWKSTFDMLYVEYFEVLQTQTSSQEVMETVSDLARCCADALNVVKGLKSTVLVKQVDETERLIENERNTWRLVYVLYQDRLNAQCLSEEDIVRKKYVGYSEKFCMLNLFKRDNLVRESQLVVDWLESNAGERDDEVLHFSDKNVGWENTLHQLNSKDTIVFESSRDIIGSLDPDAPSYEDKPLHDLDVEDEKRLCNRFFREIRCGKLDVAQKLATDCGHAWRAAMLEGWKLHHNPNIENEQLNRAKKIEDTANKENEDSMKEGEDDSTRKDNRYPTDVEGDDYEPLEPERYLESEGNKNRDIWKKTALQYCEQVFLDTYDKAAIAAYCGYLKTLLPVCNDWEDFLWAYMKVMVDVRVESEIRDCVSRRYRPLPDFYWDQRRSINEIFATLEASNNPQVQAESRIPERLIQKYLILDQIPQLFDAIEDWINDSISKHFLRFIAHLILFFEQIGQAPRRDVFETVLEMYVKSLMEMHETQLVAFYVSKLGPQMQIYLYSSYLEAITESDERRESLSFAEDCGIDVRAVAKTVVENIRSSRHDLGESGLLQERITRSDEFKISSIDWLLFYESHRTDAIIQSNALVFTFLTMKKLDAAQLVFNKIPTDSVDKILSEGEVPEDINQAIREHLSYKAYLDALEAFNEWFKHFKSKPIRPEGISEDAYLTEKVAHQHRMSQFKAETERWKLTTTHLTKSAKTLLYNVLLFPDGGWLHGAKDAEFLRSTCIPECVLLLYAVLFDSKLYSECVQLADILASEKYGLYKVYSKEKLGEILEKLSETSVALLNEKMDPWGSNTM